MKVTEQQSAENRQALVTAARRLFRQHGFHSVSVARIAEAAGLTHGAFYSHFASKQEIEILAVAAIIEKAAADWREVVAAHPHDPLPQLVNGYLDFNHTSEGDVGCAFVALATDLARGTPAVREAASKALPSQIAVLETIFEDADPTTRRRKALGAYASMVGAATIAQSLQDKEQSAEICRAAAAQILGSRKTPE